MQESSNSQQKRLRVLYRGRVQGVGFRFNAQRLALDENVTGWVKNLANGDVEMVMEGSQQQIERVLDAVQASMGSHIQKTKLDWQPFQNEFTDFEIEYDL